MTENVVSFRGGPVPSEPDQDIIDLLREMLERAESGDIRAIAIAYAAGSEGNEIAGTAFEIGAGGHMFPLASAVLGLHHRFGQIMGDE